MTKNDNQTSKYVSGRFRNLTFVRKASYNKELDGHNVHVPGERIRFENGVFETDDPAVKEFLENRPEFGEIFVKVPDNIEAIAHRDSQAETLEEREARLKAREDEVAKKEQLLSSSEEGAKVEETKSQNSDDKKELPVSLKSSRKELDEYAKGLNIKDPEKLQNKTKVLEAIETAIAVPVTTHGKTQEEVVGETDEGGPAY